MSDHLVSLPNAAMPPETRASLAALALAASFAFPGHGEPGTLERDLLQRFTAANVRDASQVLAYFQQAGATALDMADLVSQFDTNPAALHQALQQHNDAQGLVLLAVQNPAQLDDAVNGAPLHAFAQGPLWLLRSGYSDDPPYGYYHDMLASGAQPVKMLWQNVAVADIIAAIALEAPQPPLDRDTLLTTLQGAQAALADASQHSQAMNTALAEANSAHEAILASLGIGRG